MPPPRRCRRRTRHRGVGEADRHEAGGGDERAGQHREGGDVQAAAAARIRSQPCSIFTTIISMAMIASSTSSPSAMISAPRVIRWKSIPQRHHQKHDGEHQRHRQRHDDAGAQAEREEADDQHDRQRLAEGLENSLIECRPHAAGRRSGRLSMPTGSSARIASISASSVLPERDDVAALRHDNAEADRRPAVLAHEAARRIDDSPASPSAMSPRRNAAAAGFDRHRRDRLGAVERAGDAHGIAVARGLDAAGRRHRFCRARLSKIARGVTPRVASLTWLNST